MSVNIVSQF